MTHTQVQMDWPKLDWPKLVKSGWPKRDWPKSVPSFDDLDFTFNGYANTLACLSSLAESSETITNSGDGDSTARTAVCNLAVSSHDAHTERSTESRVESWKQRFRSLQTTVPGVRNVRSGRQHGIVRANHDIQVRFPDRRPSARISGTGETMRRTVQIPFPTK